MGRKKGKKSKSSDADDSSVASQELQHGTQSQPQVSQSGAREQAAQHSESGRGRGRGGHGSQDQPQIEQSASTSGAFEHLSPTSRGRGQSRGGRGFQHGAQSQPQQAQSVSDPAVGVYEQPIQAPLSGRGWGQNRGGRGFQHGAQSQPQQAQSVSDPAAGVYEQRSQTPTSGRGWGRGGVGIQQVAQTQPQQVESVSEPSQTRGRGRGQGQNRGGHGHQQRAPSQQQHAHIEGSTPDYGQQGQLRTGGTRDLASGDQLDSQKQTMKQIPQGMSTSTQVVSKSSTKVEDIIEAMDKLNVGGKSGRPIKVLTNHFELKLGKIKQVMHYDVDIIPDKPKKLLKVVVQLCKNKYFPKTNPAFDGKKNLYSAYDLPFGYEMQGEVTLEEEGRSKEYKIKIKKVNTIDLTIVNNFVSQYKNRNMSIKEPLNAVQALDIILRHSLSLKFITCGSSFYPSPQNRIPLGEGMEMYRGMFQSVTLGWKPFINVDVSNKAFPSELNIIDLITDLLRQPNLNDYLRDYDLETLKKTLKTLRVRIDIPNSPTSRRTMKVNGLESSSDRFTFVKEDGSKQTVKDYFLREKKVNLKYPKMPCVWVGNLQKKIMYPCELCTVLPGQVVNRKLSANQTRVMIKECATNTNVRMDGIKNNIRNANYNADPVIKEFDLSVSNEFHAVNGRILDPPGIRYLQPPIQKVSKGVWRANKFLKPVSIKKWYVLNLDSRLYQNVVENFAKQIQIKSTQLGIDIAQPSGIDNLDVRRRALDGLKNYFSRCKDADIIFVIITEDTNIYNFVKQASELNIGCLTQCIKSRTIQRRLDDSTMGNVMLKVNAKLNGTNHTFFEKHIIMQRPTMVMGADVTHPGPDSQTIPSFAAVTASFDPNAFRYNLCWRIQSPKQEEITDLQAIVKEQLLFFYQKNGQRKPEKIIFYRDGVSNGQFNAVLSIELQAMRRACQSLQQDYKPQITFIVVQKRHHTRLFPANPRDSEDRNINVPAGTCVDTDITLPNRQNFFLVSHASIQGVAKPTRYVILWDDNNFSDDDLEKFTYQLCHLFTRCTRSVSYPAPTYYAHLAAARAKVYCETEQLNMNNLEHEQTRFQIKECIVKDMPMFFV